MIDDLDVRLDTSRVERMLIGVEKKAVPRATTQSLNKTIQTVGTRSRRQVARETGLKQAAMRRHMRIVKARPSRKLATLIAESYAPNIASFAGARQTREGVRARVWGTSQLHRGAFIANQGRTAFARVSAKRLPLKALRGPSLRRHYLRRHIRAEMKAIGIERWSIEMDRALKRQIAIINR